MTWPCCTKSKLATMRQTFCPSKHWRADASSSEISTHNTLEWWSNLIELYEAWGSLEEAKVFGAHF